MQCTVAHRGWFGDVVSVQVNRVGNGLVIVGFLAERHCRRIAKRKAHSQEELAMGVVAIEVQASR